MTQRELFSNIMQYGSFDRMPVLHWKGWPETYPRWYREGLPKDTDQHAFFNASPHNGFGISPINGLFPPFEEEVLEDRGDSHIVRQSDGAVAQRFKNQSALPHYVDFLFKDRSGWAEYERRLQPHPARIPSDLQELAKRAADSGLPVTINAGSMVGWLRGWMGVNNFCIACCEDPDLIGEVVNTIAGLVCWCLEQILPTVKADMAWGWEDICFKTGPLVQPDLFERVVVPGYRRISETLRKHGCDIFVVDSDGRIDELVPHWLEGGVNTMFPVEIGTWDADPMAFRRKYGRELRVIGGINKLVLERGREAIDAEVERRRPLMAEGGFIPLPDHLITPDTPLDDYRYYLDRIRNLRF